MHTDITAVTINLTKLFQMKLKTTRHYWSHHMGKTKQTFWPTEYLDSAPSEKTSLLAPQIPQEKTSGGFCSSSMEKTLLILQRPA